MVPYRQRTFWVPHSTKGRILRDLGILVTAAIVFISIAILCLTVNVP